MTWHRIFIEPTAAAESAHQTGGMQCGGTFPAFPLPPVFSADLSCNDYDDICVEYASDWVSPGNSYPFGTNDVDDTIRFGTFGGSGAVHLDTTSVAESVDQTGIAASSSEKFPMAPARGRVLRQTSLLEFFTSKPKAHNQDVAPLLEVHRADSGTSAADECGHILCYDQVEQPPGDGPPAVFCGAADGDRTGGKDTSCVSVQVPATTGPLAATIVVADDPAPFARPTLPDGGPGITGGCGHPLDAPSSTSGEVEHFSPSGGVSASFVDARTIGMSGKPEATIVPEPSPNISVSDDAEGIASTSSTPYHERICEAERLWARLLKEAQEALAT